MNAPTYFGGAKFDSFRSGQMGTFPFNWLKGRGTYVYLKINDASAPLRVSSRSRTNLLRTLQQTTTNNLANKLNS